MTESSHAVFLSYASQDVALAGYTEAIRLDLGYALAFADRSLARAEYAGRAETGAAVPEGFKESEADARRAVTLAPELAQAHLALAFIASATFDVAQANAEFARALALAPGSAEILGMSAGFAAHMGHFDAGIAAARRAVALDPLDYLTYQGLGYALFGAQSALESIAAGAALPGDRAAVEVSAVTSPDSFLF